MPHSLVPKPAVPLPGVATVHSRCKVAAHHTVTAGHHTGTAAHHTLAAAHRAMTVPLPLHVRQPQRQPQYPGVVLALSPRGEEPLRQSHEAQATSCSSISNSNITRTTTSGSRLKVMASQCSASDSGQQQQQQDKAGHSLQSCVGDEQQGSGRAQGQGQGEGEGEGEGEGGGKSARTVVSFYKFADLSADSQVLRARLEEFCRNRDLDGFILVAHEGVNGSICGGRAEVDALFAWLEADARLAGMRRNYTPAEDQGQPHSHSHSPPHSRSQSQHHRPDPAQPRAPPDEPFRWGGVRVRHKAEIVTMGVPEVSPSKAVGTYVSPWEWNDLISDPDTLVIDVRNEYETRLGRFRGAVDPCTRSFRDFPSWVQSALVRHGSQGQEAEGGDGQQDGEGEQPRPGVPREGQPASGAPPSGEGRSAPGGPGEGLPQNDQGRQGPEKPLSVAGVEGNPFRNFVDRFNKATQPEPSWILPALFQHGNGGGERGEEGVSEGVGNLQRTRSEEVQSPAWEQEDCAATQGRKTVTQGEDTVTQASGGFEASSESATLGDGAAPQPRKVAMYCTGGIRCEKATSLLLSLGFREVYHLEGGILSYLRDVPESQSLWEGECFVFDKRVAVKTGLARGSYRLCFACKEPVGPSDTLSPLWEEGVSCPHCYGKKSEAERARARARHMQYLHWGRVGGPAPESPVTGHGTGGSAVSGAAKSRLGRTRSL